MSLRSLPGIDRVLLIPRVRELCERYPRELVTDCAREAVESLREDLAAGSALPVGSDGKLDDGVVAKRVEERLTGLLSPSLRRVVNATGIVIHTNLGRSPMPPDMIDAIAEILGSYSNLEFDLDSGKRGSRHDHLERLIPAVTGAEAGFVVNNCAAAVMVCLATLARGREVVVSRGELIEIGGSFRIPEIIESGGARLREVGATNKTRLSDYERAIGHDTGLLFKAHASNFRIMGFTEEVSLADLVKLGRSLDIPVMMDLGSGLLTDLAGAGIEGEVPVSEYVKAGPDIITFSGDKLLGGPQAGFIVGKKEAVERIKKNPMVRALRVGKLTIAALGYMLGAYLKSSDPKKDLPTLSLLTRDAAAVRAVARRLKSHIDKVWPEVRARVEADTSFAGGGALPARELPTSVVALAPPEIAAEELARRFRLARTPVVGRIRNGEFCLDCRSLLDGDPARIVASLGEIKGVGY